MIKYNHLLLAPSKLKRMIVYTLLHLTGNYKEMHGLMVNFKANSACEDSTRKLKQLYQAAKERAVCLINEYSEYILKENKLNALYDFTFSGKRIEQE